MNAKELAEKLRRSAMTSQLTSSSRDADMFERIALDVEQLIPRYRPPRPEDDGKLCWIETDHDDCNAKPQRCFQMADKTWWYWSTLWVREMPLTCGVWPCERPEVNRERES